MGEEKSTKDVLEEHSVMSVIAKFIFHNIFYGEDYTEYNTVADTIWCCNFVLLQLLRLVMFLALSTLSLVYLYIYFSHCVFLLNFWSLLFTTIAFGVLFVGSGMQMVYQKKLERSGCEKKYNGLKYGDVA